MNRPDGGPQPRHAIERDGDAWTHSRRQIVSGPFRIVAGDDEHLVLERRADYANVSRPGTVARVEYRRSAIEDGMRLYEQEAVDMVAVRYTPRLADRITAPARDAVVGPAAWTGYLAFDHSDAQVSNPLLRRALAHAIDREQLARILPDNLIAATGGLVPPALQGHTPDIVPRFDPVLARDLIAQCDVSAPIRLAGLRDWQEIIDAIAAGWAEVLGVRVETPTWTPAHVARLARPWEEFVAPIVVTGWLPGYSDPEYYLRLLLHSESKTNEGGYAHAPFDELIEQARHERNDRARLELYHAADRMAVAEQIALIPIAYGRSMAIVKPRVSGWWEFGKSSAAYADLVID